MNPRLLPLFFSEFYYTPPLHPKYPTGKTLANYGVSSATLSDYGVDSASLASYGVASATIATPVDEVVT